MIFWKFSEFEKWVSFSLMIRRRRRECDLWIWEEHNEFVYVEVSEEREIEEGKVSKYDRCLDLERLFL